MSIEDEFEISGYEACNTLGDLRDWAQSQINERRVDDLSVFFLITGDMVNAISSYGEPSDSFYEDRVDPVINKILRQVKSPTLVYKLELSSYIAFLYLLAPRCYDSRDLGFDELCRLRSEVGNDADFKHICEGTCSTIIVAENTFSRSNKSIWLTSVVSYINKLHNKEYDSEFIGCLDVLSLEDYLNFEEVTERLGSRQLLVDLAKKEKDLQSAKEELEDLMALCAHEFRSPIQNIIFNSDHENNPNTTRRAARSINNLLETFSTISTDTELLQSKLANEEVELGDETPFSVFQYALYLALYQALAKGNISKIRQHYYLYALRNKLIDQKETLSDWKHKHRDIEKDLQSKWEKEIFEYDDIPKLTGLLNWISDKFFHIDLDINFQTSFTFDNYKDRYAILLMIFQEIIANAIKYSSSCKETQLECKIDNTTDYFVFKFSNPCGFLEQNISKGNNKGHRLLKLILNKLGGDFEPTRVNNTYSATLLIPKHLFL